MPRFGTSRRLRSASRSQDLGHLHRVAQCAAEDDVSTVPIPCVLFEARWLRRSSSVDEPENHVRLVPTTESICASLPPVAGKTRPMGAASK